MIINNFVVKINKTSLVLKADAATLRDIAAILDHLVSMVHLLRNRAKITENQIQRKARAKQYQVNQLNQKKSVEIYNRFQSHLFNGCNGNINSAVHKINEEYHLLSVDSKYFVSEGKKIFKEEQKMKQLKLFKV